MIERTQELLFLDKVKSSKLLLVQGPNGVGREELITNSLNQLNGDIEEFDCKDKSIRKSLANGLSSHTSSYIVLHEAQYLANLTVLLQEVLIGKCKSSVIVSCSFTPKIDPELFEAMRIEGLVLTIYAPSFYETAKHFGLPEEERLLEERLIYGNYPSVLEDLSNAESTLNWIIEDAIFTKLSAKDRINKGDKLIRVLQLLAFSIGETISFNDIGDRCGLDNETVERYIELFEEAFLLIHLKPYHTERRYELRKSNMVYFVDNGIRNALIQNFNPPHLRNDLPKLWKNYIISERVKWQKINQNDVSTFFWRTHTNQQMDYVEQTDSELSAYKIDWEKRKKVKIPNYFTSAYPMVKTSVLNRSTYWSFLTKKINQ